MMQSVPEKVLVLGADDRSGLAVVRSLGRKHIEVHVGWCSPGSVVTCSRYVSMVHDIPSYSATDGRWRDALVSLMKKEAFHLVIPCSDPVLIPLQKNRKELESFGEIYLLDDRTFDVTMDKIKMNEVVRKLGINLSREQVLVKENQVEEILQECCKWPLVVKPKSSFIEKDLHAKRYVRIARDSKELRNITHELLNDGPIQIQEYFKGRGVGIEVLVDHGEILVSLQHERIHEPKNGGGSSYRKTVPLNAEMHEAVQLVMRELEYTGVAMVEFKFNVDSGEWIFVELNGRFWGSLPLAIAAGADFPFYLYALLIKGMRDFPKSYRVGLYGRNIRKDVGWFEKALLEQNKGIGQRVKVLFQAMKEAMNIVTFRESNDTFVWDDVKPGLIEFRETTRYIQGIFKKRMTRQGWFQVLRKKTDRHFLKHYLKTAECILFLCKGNICRSPFAEAYARQQFPVTLKVMSCGYFPEEGRKCPDDAVSAAHQFQVDLGGHRSEIVTREMLENANIVFLFDQENRDKIINLFPDIKRKLFFLGSLSDNDSIHIKDPNGGTVEVFTETYRLIRFSIDRLVKLGQLTK